MASKGVVSAVTNTTKGVACEGLSGLDRIGSSVTRHANMAVNDLMGKRSSHSGKRSRSRGKPRHLMGKRGTKTRKHKKASAKN